MKHNISLYDTGRINSYDRRNEGLSIASGIVGICLAVTGFVMILGGLFDPTATFSVAVVGFVLLGSVMMHGALYMTHRNFGLSVKGVKVMDAIYSLPKKDRKRFKISRDEVAVLDPYECDTVVNEIASYRRNRTGTSGIGLMLGEISEYNKMVNEIEGKR